MFCHSLTIAIWPLVSLFWFPLIFTGNFTSTEALPLGKSLPYLIFQVFGVRAEHSSYAVSKLTVCMLNLDNFDALLKLAIIVNLPFSCTFTKFLTDWCEEPRLGLNHLNSGNQRQRVPLQNEDYPGNNPHLVPGFPRLCSGMFPERFRSASVSVGSEETRLI